MPYWTLPPIPGFSLFLFAFCGLIFVLGVSGYIVERRKEIKKERDRKLQSARWAEAA